MAKLIDVLETTVSPVIFGRETQIIGNKIFVRLDDARRVELSLETAGYSGNYEVLLMKLTSKTHGELNRTGLKFKDLIGVGKMVSEDFNGGYCWYRATEKDLVAIRKSVHDYIELWD